MTIKVGDRVPDGQFGIMTAQGPSAMTTDELFAGKTVVFFALPGAFTPTCSAKHLPGYVATADDLAAHGADTIACMSVNDAFVMAAWGEDQNVGGKVLMLADGNGTYAQALGLSFDGSGFGMGERAQRFSMIVEDGVVKSLNIEAPGAFEVSDADTALSQL